MTQEELKIHSDKLKSTVNIAIEEFIRQTQLVPIVEIEYAVTEGYGCAAEKTFADTKVSIRL